MGEGGMNPGISTRSPKGRKSLRPSVRGFSSSVLAVLRSKGRQGTGWTGIL